MFGTPASLSKKARMDPADRLRILGAADTRARVDQSIERYRSVLGDSHVTRAEGAETIIFTASGHDTTLLD
ncbi:MAG: hypothetical protein NVS3B21_32400 [Acidimicrobiales bacterium]